MTGAATTRERLVSEAMRLFSLKGYDATSISQIEAAAGLAAGSGALYHHFKSKEALLDAGIDRQLDRRAAMSNIRALFAGLGDLQAELTALGRYLLAVADEELELLQVAARTQPGRSARLDTAYAAFIDGLNTELAGWITTWAPKLAPSDCAVLASVSVNALLGVRLAAALFRQPDANPPEDRYLTEWTQLLRARIENAQ